MRTYTRVLIIFAVSAVVFCCQDRHTKKSGQENSGAQHIVTSVLWYQHSAEMRACYHQTFNFAKILLDKHLKNADKSKRQAIIVDIDETVLDNSPYEAWLAFSGSEFSLKSWKTWTSLCIAEPLPGSVEFLNYAKSKDVQIFYISNRETDELESTVENLRKFSFPSALPSYLLLKTDGKNDKKARRNIVKQDYEILLLIGDSLTDFDSIFENRSKDFGFKAVDENRQLFGDRYLILPNPMYGKWERALYENSGNLSQKQKAVKRLGALKTY